MNSISFNSFTKVRSFALSSVAFIAIAGLVATFVLYNQQIINHDAYLSGIVSGSALLGIDAIVFMVMLCRKPAQIIELPPDPAPKNPLGNTGNIKENQVPPPPVINQDDHSATESTVTSSHAQDPKLNTVIVNTNGIEERGTSFLAEVDL